MVDALGNPIYIQLTGGHVHDAKVAVEILYAVGINEGTIVMADKAYDSKQFLQAIQDKKAQSCIPSKRNAKEPREIDKHQYKERSNVECFFQKLKQFRRVATRYEKLAVRFYAMIVLCCVCILLK